MGTRKSKHREAQPHESRGGYLSRGRGKVKDDVYARIYESMVRSPAFLMLTHRQQVLFLLCKLQWTGKRKPGRDFEEYQGDDLFYLNWAAVCDDYGFYTQGSKKNFYDDMGTLIDYGLIDKVASGKSQRKKTVYRFSVRWKDMEADQIEQLKEEKRSKRKNKITGGEETTI